MKIFATAVAIIFGSAFLCQISAFRQPKCRGKETKLTKEELTMMSECLKQFGSDGSNFGNIPKDSMACVGKCILQKQGLVDKAGVPVKDNVFKMMNETMEPEVAKLADERVGKCIDEKSTGIDANEKACKTYWPLVECVAAAFTEICATNNETTTKAPS